ncbi:uncharacterized protein LOC121375890 isoform X2 [Gigantopelta aegis]|nr:uncharacterized protein LOC121375890 isoform X2 [Gigantopelta aegis]
MEEDKSGLNILISQRLHRPNLSRMISWEIEKEKPQVGSSKRRKKAKKKLSLQDSAGSVSPEVGCSGSHGDNIDSDGSEYYSAEECFISSDSESSADSPSLSLHGFDLEDDIPIDESDDDEEVDGERKRALSKKQKRRRRERLKLCFADYMIPFRNVEHIDLDASDLFEFCPSDVHVTRVVPSLFQLALHTLWRRKQTKTSSQSYTKLPRVMKTEVSDLQLGQSFASIQLSLLYRLLAYVEKHIKEILRADYDSFKKIKNYKIEFVKRNVWSYVFFERSMNTNFIGHESTAWLPFTYFGYGALYSDNMGHHLYQVALISILSVVMDLMLPRSISAARYNKSRKRTRSETDVMKQAMQSLLRFVKHSLSKRYPEVVKHVFDWAVPYFHWSRGNISLAAEAFLENSEKVDGVNRACLLSEAARLYCHHDQPDMASQLYREAANSVLDCGNLEPLAVDQISAQRFALMADINDQGVMTSPKAEEAASTWRSVLKLAKHAPPGLGSRAIESLLCFHAGSRQGVSDADILKEALNLASPEVMSDTPQLYLHLSLIYALLGNSAESLAEYKQFKVYYFENDIVPGSFMMTKGDGRTFNPWQHLLKHTETGNILHLLDVAWRTQLGHMRIVKDKDSFDGDVASYPDLHLTMTSDGFLSADLQMVLPSMRNLKLDPYTGSIVYDQLSRVNFPWHSLDFLHAEMHNYNGRFLTPTTVELYNDGAGNRVHILCSDVSLMERTDFLNKFITLYWTGAGGQKAKLNLFSRIRKACYEAEIEHITAKKEVEFDRQKSKKISLAYYCSNADEYHAAYLKALLFCYERGWSCDFHTVDRVLQGMVDQLHPKKSKTKKKTSQKPKSTRIKNPYNFNKWGEPTEFNLKISYYFSYYQTILMLFSTKEHSNCVAFIDCSNRENFLSPKIIADYKLLDSIINEDEFPKVDRHVLPRAEIMWHSVYITSDRKACLIYGQKGELLKTTYPDEEGFTPQSHTFTRTPVVLGRKMYGTTDDKLSIICDDLSDNMTFSDSVPEVRKLSVIADKLMVVTVTGLYIFDPESLQPCQIIVKCESCSLKLDDKHESIVDVEHVEIVGTKLISDGTVRTERVALSADNHLVILDFTQSVELIMCTALAGLAKEVCFVGKKSLLASCTLHSSSTSFYREHIYHLSYSGQLLGILPFLGPGPRGFLPVWLPNNEDALMVDSRLGQAGWRVFMRDGHEGIMSILLV